MVELIGALKKEQEESMADSHEEEEEEKAEKGVSDEEKAEKVKRKRRKRVPDPQRKRACVDCTKRCVRVHGRASSSEKAGPIPTLPSFFKIMMGYFSENMDIPLPFAKTILDLTDSNVYLEDAFGLRWRVQLCLHDGLLSFGHGWKNFVLDHAIGVGEFLVFSQIARSVFTVQIFATSACERMHLCEKNKRQSRKRKPKQNTSTPRNQTVKISKNGKKKQRADLGLRECNMSIHLCIDSESEQKCSETSEKELDVVAVESHGTRDQDKAQEVLDGDTGAADDCTTCKKKEAECDAAIKDHPIYDATGSKTLESMAAIGASSNTKDMTMDANKSENYPYLSYSVACNMMMGDKGSARSHQDRQERGNVETENCEDSNMRTNAELRTSLAMMDLNEVSVDDIFLSADIYEFESDFCSPDGFSVELNMERLVTNGQTSGNCDSSMEVSHCFGMPDTSSCLQNKEMTDAQRTSTDAANVPVHDIGINALPSNELSALGEDNSSPAIDAEVPSIECALDACKKDKGTLLFHPEGKQVSQKDNSSVKEDNLQDSPGHTAEINMPGSPKPCKLSDVRKKRKQPGNTCYPGWNNCKGHGSGSTESGGVLAANKRKFCISVPPPDQTWLELPGRLSVLPRTKKQGRKILILKDPCMRLWPVLYQCTPKFNGFITGWADISRENNLREGDTYEFELCSNSELSFRMHMPSLQ